MTEPVLQRNAAIEVVQVANGFLVKRPSQMNRGEWQPIEDSMVFQSFAALADWMGKHFTHRDTGVKNDA